MLWNNFVNKSTIIFIKEIKPISVIYILNDGICINAAVFRTILLLAVPFGTAVLLVNCLKVSCLRDTNSM